MHDKNGLIERVRASRIDTREAERQLLSRISALCPHPAVLAGNSVWVDRMFLMRYMPAVAGFLHYRMIDVSSIKELCRRWYPRIYFGQPEKGLAHRALADIKESIRELQYYRRTAFVTDPGPSTTDIAAIAAEISGAANGNNVHDAAGAADAG
jgi:oligoribonuclease